MNILASLPRDERRALFTETGASLGLDPFYVEKDFWVCWVLEVLFNNETTGPHLTFRGGTSLSKAWAVIERFSEDVDLAMSRPWLGDASDPGDGGLVGVASQRRDGGPVWLGRWARWRGSGWWSWWRRRRINVHRYRPSPGRCRRSCCASSRRASAAGSWCL